MNVDACLLKNASFPVIPVRRHEWGISDGREANDQTKPVQLSQVVHCLEELVFNMCFFRSIFFPSLLVSLNSFSLCLCLFLSPLTLYLKSRFRDWGEKSLTANLEFSQLFF